MLYSYSTVFLACIYGLLLLFLDELAVVRHVLHDRVDYLPLLQLLLVLVLVVITHKPATTNQLFNMTSRGGIEWEGDVTLVDFVLCVVVFVSQNVGFFFRIVTLAERHVEDAVESILLRLSEKMHRNNRVAL